MAWLVAALSFVGGLLGAGIPVVVALRGQRQTARQEWRLRLDRAVDLMVSSEDLQRVIGDQLLTELVNSDLGSEADRDLARRPSAVRVEFFRKRAVMEIQLDRDQNGGSEGAGHDHA